MANRRGSIVPDERTRRGRTTGEREGPQPRFAVIGAAPVVLAAITGRQQQCRPSGMTLFLQQGNGFGAAECQALALLYSRRMVADSNDMEGKVGKHATTLGAVG